METELIELFVPENILQYVDYDKLEMVSGVIHIHFVEKNLSAPCVNLCVHCGKNLNREKNLNRYERKEHAKSAMKEKNLCSHGYRDCGKKVIIAKSAIK